jgi:hypothetical protein
LDKLLSIGQWAIKAAIALSAFAIPAWAARAANILGEYAPFSWVAIGILGALALAGAYALWGWGRQRHRRASYDKRMLQRGSYVDPLEKTFERRRIFLNEFALPSHPLIEDKTFIDCEIIGPANIILDTGNRVDEPRFPLCDTVLMSAPARPFNGYAFRRCAFRGCSFQRITFLIPAHEYEMARGVDWLNWITLHPDAEEQGTLPFPEAPVIDVQQVRPEIMDGGEASETDGRN